jgi:ABC-type polysaccharide/polyol phosphate export permease
MYETITEILGFATFILIILSGIIYVIKNIKDIFKEEKK